VLAGHGVGRAHFREILHETHIVPGVIILMPTVLIYYYLYIRPGNNYLFDLG
jgi:hypothetical protein